MTRFQLGVLTVWTLAFAGFAAPTYAADDAPAIRKEVEPPASLVKAINDGRKLLAEGKTTEFLDRFVEPTAKQELKDSGRWAAVVERFSTETAGKLKRVLDAAAEKKPTLTADGALAEYHVPGQPGDRTDLKFVLVADVWYLKK